MTMQEDLESRRDISGNNTRKRIKISVKDIDGLE